MGAVKHYNVTIDGVTVYSGPIRTSEIVYRALESFVDFLYRDGQIENVYAKHPPSIALSFKL